MVLTFYRNVITLRSGICYRKSICRLSSVYVTLVHPTQGVEMYGNVFT